MDRLDPDELRAYAARDWGAPARLAREKRATRPTDEKVRIAIELYEATKATRPDWPDEATRRADLESHLRVRALLESHVTDGRIDWYDSEVGPVDLARLDSEIRAQVVPISGEGVWYESGRSFHGTE